MFIKQLLSAFWPQMEFFLKYNFKHHDFPNVLRTFTPANHDSTILRSFFICSNHIQKNGTFPMKFPRFSNDFSIQGSGARAESCAGSPDVMGFLGP
jgi:hypothetical protein